MLGIKTKSSVMWVGAIMLVAACSPDSGVTRPTPAGGTAGRLATGAAGAPATGLLPAAAQPSAAGALASAPRAGAAGTSSTLLPPAGTPTMTLPPATTPPAQMGGVPFPTNDKPAVPAGAAGAAAPSGGPTQPTTPPTGAGPMIPAVKGDCPKFANGVINFMGLGGITVVAGAKAAGPTAPFVFYWHGTGSTSGEYAGMAAAVSQGVTSEGGVLVSFQGSTGGDALSGTSVFGKGDLDVGDQLVACAVRDHNVDPRRIFATGCSAGGLFSTNQTVLRSSYMAAAAPNSGGMAFPQAFQATGIPALMTVHGAPGSDVVIIDFSQSSMTADNAFKQKGAFVINCNHGGGHCGGGGLAPDVWKFFKAHPFGTNPSPWKDALPAGFNAKCKIF